MMSEWRLGGKSEVGEGFTVLGELRGRECAQPRSCLRPRASRSAWRAGARRCAVRIRQSAVTVVHEGFDPAPIGQFGMVAARLRAAWRETLEVLRSLEDLAPGMLRHVDQETLARCSVSRVTIPQLDAAMVESYALTSADLVRPPVEVYLVAALSIYRVGRGAGSRTPGSGGPSQRGPQWSSGRSTWWARGCCSMVAIP